jgi:adenosylcobinamide-GDP ribazoletransferase
MESAASSRRSQGLHQLPLLAFEFLTALRLRRPVVVDGEALGRSQAFFPLVGLVLGGLLAFTDWLLPGSLGADLSGWLLAGLLIALTGALHVDGLADTVDGLLGGSTPARRLEIMRDPAIGAFGAAAVVVVIGIKATALGELAGDARREVIILAPALSRWACVVAISAFPYARPEGLGSAFHGSAWPWAAPFAGLTCLAAAGAGLGSDGAIAWAGCALGALLLGLAISSKIGGLTGDSYGAVVEVVETAFLVAAVGWIGGR